MVSDETHTINFIDNFWKIMDYFYCLFFYFSDGISIELTVQVNFQVNDSFSCLLRYAIEPL